MIDESKLYSDAGRAMRAKQLLENELLSEAFGTLETSYIAAWRATKIEDVNAREKLFLAINVLGKVREHLASVISNGVLATAELRSLAEAAERKQRWQDVR